jgi:gamma-glutamyltranspeptidase/glutathione hydrolase
MRASLLCLALLPLALASPVARSANISALALHAPSQGKAPEHGASGSHGAVASEVDVCSNVGVDMLALGGSAADAVSCELLLVLACDLPSFYSCAPATCSASPTPSDGTADSLFLAPATHRQQIIAASLCVGVIGAFHSGLGGGGFALVRTAFNKYESYDFRETMPALGNATVSVALHEGGGTCERHGG